MPWHASVLQAAEFLNDLFKKGELKVHTIKGYKLAIAATLAQRGLNVGTNPYNCGLVNSFYMDRPLEVNLVPRWDLTLVLNTLTKLPFELRDIASVN